MSMFYRKSSFFSLGVLLWVASCFGSDWQMGPFVRIDGSNPILVPCAESTFHCPVQNKEIRWEAEHVFNPGVVVKDGKIFLFYRAEDNYGVGCGMHTSRIGVAMSDDGVNFHRFGTPILYPDLDGQEMYEFPGGCEDPRIVEREDGVYVMMYSQWNRQVAILGVATSTDLIHWKKHGYAFEGNHIRRWSKSGSIVCRQKGDRLIATKIQGKYWMYWGEGCIYAATSEDLIHWKPVKDEDGFQVIMEPRSGKFDSLLVEAGPPALVTEQGILLLYNGQNSAKTQKKDPSIAAHAYSAGQVLFDLQDPTKIVHRCKDCFLTPERPYERRGQYQDGTVFIQGLVPFQGTWLLYYGTADSAIAVARLSDATSFISQIRIASES